MSLQLVGARVILEEVEQRRILSLDIASRSTGGTLALFHFRVLLVLAILSS